MAKPEGRQGTCAWTQGRHQVAERGTTILAAEELGTFKGFDLALSFASCSFSWHPTSISSPIFHLTRFLLSMERDVN